MEKQKNLMRLQSLLILLFVICFDFVNAQNQTELEELKASMQPIEQGEINLYLLDTEKSRRFFVEKNSTFTELLPGNYKEVIDQVTSDKDLNTLKVNYDLKSLSKVVRSYNSLKDKSPKSLDIGARIGVWAGMSNFVQYPSIQNANDNNLFFGVELEAYGKKDFKRHATVFQLRKSIPGDVIDLDLTEFMLGYRFNIINHKIFMLYFEAELVHISYYDLIYSDEVTTQNPEPRLYKDSGRLDLDAPLGLGVGLAVQLSKGMYFTLGYSNLVQINETRNDFPVDIRTGLKFNW